MKHITFTKKDIEEGEYEIKDRYNRLKITVNHPILADLIVEMLNIEFERVTLQMSDAKDTAKEIANEDNE